MPRSVDPTSGRRRVAATVVLLAGLLAGLLAACGSPATGPSTPSGPTSGAGDASGTAAPAPSTPAPDPAVKPYCDAVAAVQAEQASPQSGQGGVPAASAAARRQIASLVRTAPPEIAGDWRVLQQLTDRALGSLATTGGDPKRIDRRTLDDVSRRSQPTIAHIKTVTERRCGVTFSAPGAR